jgi:anhydro-N-acetylmuramic acid kinase
MSAGPTTIIGTMSGTSLDGVTAAVARFHATPDGESVDLLSVVTVLYAEPLRVRLAAAMQQSTAAEVVALGAAVGEATADAARAALAESGVAVRDVAAVAMHGQTLWHAPPVGSWQLGDAARVAERLGLGVVSDFRARDMAAGGHGAPLVPLADAMLFGAADGARALQNIGGMANVTIVPRLGSVEGVRAFDTGPGVAVMDAVTQTLTGAQFDRDGALADAGTIIDEVLTARLADPFFRAEPPKSTGREHFGHAYAQTFLADCRRARPTASDADVIATATALTARSIADAYRRFVPNVLRDVLLSGGGAHNRALVRQVEQLLAPTPVRRFDACFFDGDAKEAVAFAYLAWRHLRGLWGNVPAATGAHGPRVLGRWTPA